jgi:hypothetical protein
MMLILLGLALAAATAFLVRRAASSRADLVLIAILSLPLMPLAAMSITGDVSRYLPPDMFSDGHSGVGEIALASAFASLVTAVCVAALAVWAGRTWLWR